MAIDISQCIGCHACTIACKSEHQVPLDAWRCWVKEVEKGVFPNIRKHFLPLLCNQCNGAPCAVICPTKALDWRDDGIVDLDDSRCIGCKACMAACPYQQIFINENTNTAEKCNFCANRIEVGLEPACVVVCPTQCRIFGDLENPDAKVRQIAQRQPISVRKPDKRTGPRIYYVGAEQSAIVPSEAMRTNPEFRTLADAVMQQFANSGHADPIPDVLYQARHRQPWGNRIVGYLLAKSLATGAGFLSFLAWGLASPFTGAGSLMTTLLGPLIALVFLLLTALLLITDLKHPQRFYYFFTTPNLRSWMTWGAYFLTAYGIVLTLWVLAWLLDLDSLRRLLWAPGMITAFLSTMYTAFFFAQASARDLWLGAHSAIDILAQGAIAGAAIFLILAATLGDHVIASLSARLLIWSLAAHCGALMFETVLRGSKRLDLEHATKILTRGAFRWYFWLGALVIGCLLPVILLLASSSAAITIVAPCAALLGMAAWEFAWVHAGQGVPLA